MSKQLTVAERKAILDAAEEVAAEMADEPLPSRAELEDMSLDELKAYMESRGVTIDWDRLDAQVREQIGTDVVQLNQGKDLDPARSDAMEKNARKALVSAARTVANQTMGDLRQNAMDESDPRPPDERFGVWVTVGGKGVCPDCKDRHGLVFRMDAWEGNAPRDGVTICDGNCRCSIVPCADPGIRNEGKYL